MITGKMLIGQSAVLGDKGSLSAINPATHETLGLTSVPAVSLTLTRLARWRSRPAIATARPRQSSVLNSWKRSPPASWRWGSR